MPGRLHTEVSSLSTSIPHYQEHVHAVVKNEHISPRILHEVVAEPGNEIGYIGRLSVMSPGWYGDFMLSLVREEQF